MLNGQVARERVVLSNLADAAGENHPVRVRAYAREADLLIMIC
jgi:hypothetical protein